MYTYINFKKYGDASNNVISGNEPSSEMLTNQSKKKQNEPKQVMPKRQDLRRSLETNLDFWYRISKYFQ